MGGRRNPLREVCHETYQRFGSILDPAYFFTGAGYGKRYSYVVYYKGEWAEGHSSPVIIIKPGS